MVPDFLGIGAQKAGTTWLHENLRRHPQIWLPPVKELHYLDHGAISLRKRLFGKTQTLKTARRHLRRELMRFARSGGDAGELRWALRYCLGRRNDAWYRSLFSRSGARVIGEICPGYARLGEAAVGRVYRLMPNAKILYLLRNPIDRAWSAAAMHFRKPRFGRIDETDEQSILAHLMDPRTVAHGDYRTNLRSWRAHYPRERIFIGFFDELSASPSRFLRRILEFLELDASEWTTPADVATRRNAGREGPVPERFRRVLAARHHEQLVLLNDEFGNDFTKRWLAAAESDLARGSDGRRGPGIQSGPGIHRSEATSRISSGGAGTASLLESEFERRGVDPSSRRALDRQAPAAERCAAGLSQRTGVTS